MFKRFIKVSILISLAILTDYLGGEAVAGVKLKEIGTTHWDSTNTSVTHETGFTALPGGGRYYGGNFYFFEHQGTWWSASEYNTDCVWLRTVNSRENKFGSGYSYSEMGFSVRCVKDLKIYLKKVPSLGIILYLCIKIKISMERIFAKSTLREFWEKFPDSELYLKTWYDTAMSSDWKSPSDVKQTYANASILKNSRIVFNIKGNSYRMVAKFNYEKTMDIYSVHWIT